MNSLIRRVGILQLRSQQPLFRHHRIQPMFVGSHWQPGNRNLYKRKPKVKTLHFKKAELMSVLKPMRPDPDEGKPMWETCSKVVASNTADQPLTQYETVLKNIMVSRLKQSQFLAVVQANPIKIIERRRCEVYLGRKNMSLGMYSMRVFRSGLQDTEYENLLHLFDGHTQLLFCKEPTIKDMLNIFKKYPQYVILAGYLEGRILSRVQIDQFANLPSLDVARAQFVSVLNSASTQLLMRLGSSQSLLTSHLDSRAEELKKNSASASTSNTDGNKLTTGGQEPKS